MARIIAPETSSSAGPRVRARTVTAETPINQRSATITIARPHSGSTTQAHAKP